jgi:hypothetical protein
MAPDAASQDLLYVSDARGVVYVYSYPGGKLEGELKGFQSPAGLCSDASGNVFVVNTNALEVDESAHGGTSSIWTLHDFGYYGFGCAVNPTNNDLAEANYASQASLGPGSVAIYYGGRSIAHFREDRAFNAYFFCGYDAKGNLFVDGEDAGSYHTLFAELPSGSSNFTDITLDQAIAYPGGVQWDGKYVAVGDVGADLLYRFKVRGTKGASSGTTSLKGDHSNLITQFVIDGSSVVLPYGTRSREVRSVGLWPYPGGGSPTTSFAVPRASELVGITLSRAQK